METASGRKASDNLMRFALAMWSCLLVMAEPESFTLTPEHLDVAVAIPSEVMIARPPILEVDVTEVSNPSLVPIGVAVSMKVGDKKIPVGNFAFFPADNKGNFLLNSQAAFARAGNPRGASLIFELRKLRSSTAWKPVRVTIAPPKWRTQ
jgi:hypothetical protein